MRSRASYNWVIFSVSFIFFAILVFYAYARVDLYPSPGFSVDSTSGIVTSIDAASSPAMQLEVGDRLLSINQVTWAAYLANPNIQILAPTYPGETLHLAVLRGEQTLTFDWAVPPTSSIELFIGYIIASEPLVYWAIGTLILLFIRPKDSRWWLLALFSYLLGVITIASTLSTWRVMGSLEVFRVAVWISLPLFFHLHTVFPKAYPSHRRTLLIGLYSLSAVLGVAEAFQVLPPNTVYIGLFFVALVVLIPLGFQYLRAKEYRVELRVILIANALALLPIVILSASNLLNQPNPWWSELVYLPLPVIPLMYFYTIIRHRLGRLTIHTNNMATMTVFYFLAFYAAMPVTALTIRLASTSTQMGLGAVLMVALICFITIFLYPYFQQWFDRRVLGILNPPSQLLAMYSSNIATSLDKGHLASMIVDQILPPLMVRQSTVLYFKPDGSYDFLFLVGLAPEDGPFTMDFPLEKLETTLGAVEFDLSHRFAAPLDWIRLAIPLRIEKTITGYWLLGRRDPDDIYPLQDMSTFQAIADQTAVALYNNLQAERLRLMYDVDIERGELERLNLAAELHDEVLNQLAVLVMKSDVLRDSEEAAQAYGRAVRSIREAINGLRPGMIYYGLGPAFETLIEEMGDQAPESVDFALEVTDDHTRFYPKIELYLFRIVQQACQNAIQHAQATLILIRGSLTQDGVDLKVIDNGVGFPPGERFDLSSLLANKHFGLAGMLERAELIGAYLEIQSEANKGSTVVLNWRVGAAVAPGFDVQASAATDHEIFIHPLA